MVSSIAAGIIPLRQGPPIAMWRCGVGEYWLCLAGHTGEGADEGQGCRNSLLGRRLAKHSPLQTEPPPRPDRSTRAGGCCPPLLDNSATGSAKQRFEV